MRRLQDQPKMNPLQPGKRYQTRGGDVVQIQRVDAMMAYMGEESWFRANGRVNSDEYWRDIMRLAGRSAVSREQAEAAEYQAAEDADRLARGGYLVDLGSRLGRGRGDR